MNNWPLKKIYLYVVCLGAMFMIVIGAVTGISSLVNSLFSSSYEGGFDRYTLSFAGSMLIVGALIWYSHWRMIKKDNN